MLEQQTKQDKQDAKPKTFYLVLSVKQLKEMIRQARKEQDIKVFRYVESPNHKEQLRDLETHEFLEMIRKSKEQDAKNKLIVQTLK